MTRQLIRDDLGAAAVEFALTVPVLLLLLLGVSEFGRLLWTQNSIQYAVEQAARCAAFKLNGCKNHAQTQAYAASLVKGYDAVAAEFTVSDGPCGATSTSGVTVSASVPFRSLLSGREELGLKRYLAVTLTGQSCRPTYS
jgi:Flp pilus assembly protein TadG